MSDNLEHVLSEIHKGVTGGSERILL